MYDPTQFTGKVPLCPPPHHPRVIFGPSSATPAGEPRGGRLRRLRRVIHKSTEDLEVKRCYYDISKEGD